VKADGRAGGKAVRVCSNRSEAETAIREMVDLLKGDTSRLVVEPAPRRQ